MESLVAFVTSSLDAATPPPPALGQAWYQDTRVEFQCDTEDDPNFSPVGDVRTRIRPIRRASSFRGRRLVKPSDVQVDQQALMKASKFMMKKNQQWLDSMEDVTALESQELEPQGLTDTTASVLVKFNESPVKGIDRRSRTLLDTIPDEAPVTITRAPSLDDLAAIVPGISSFVVDPLSNPSVQDLVRDNDICSCLGSMVAASVSSGTVTPSDATLSPGSSVEALNAPAPHPTISPSTSFTIHRGDSVDGLFIFSDAPPPEAPELPFTASDPQQSPFRRQLFTSLMTHQSALVSRVSQQSCTLIKSVAAVTEAAVPPPSDTNHTVQRPSNPITERPKRAGNNYKESNDSGHEDEAPTSQPARPVNPSPPLLVPAQVPELNRLAERLVSICDSGLGWDTDDDLHSLSMGSSSTLSEDSEGFLEEELGVLCGSRVSQMTKTYNDIEAVTRLLQEKEKDLELAAKIGQQLLNRNKSLEERNSLLDAEVASSTERITQLRHDLQMKTELLAIYTNDVDDTSSCETTPTSVRLFNMDILHDRVKNLEVENRDLRQEATKLASDTMECEDKEKELMTDVIKQLTDANLHVRQLSEELARKVEDSLRQQEEITHLLAQVVDYQAHSKRLACENDELASMVQVARECQQELTMELAELKEKYAEVLDLLHDTQDQLRKSQKKHLPGSRGHHLGSHGLFGSPFNHPGNDSIASELHSLSFVGGEEESSKGSNSTMRRTFDTVRLSSKYTGMGSSQGSLSSLGYGGSLHSTPTHLAGGTGTTGYYGSRGSSVYSGGSGHPSLDSGADSDASMHTDSEDNYPGSQLGVPGWPGTPDLDSCLRRLGPSHPHDHRTPSHFLPYGCRTPDSIMSTGSGKSGLSAYGGGSGLDWKLPQKLQIVKPIEGSLTLHQWSRLATPHLGGLLEERDGVAIKGGTGTELNLEVYSMSDLEEDEPEEENPGKQFMSTSGIYTFTNSTILHPDDQVNSTPSIRQAQVSILPTSSVTSHIASTPIWNSSVPPSRRGSTATFSVNTGLAKVLNERGTTKGDTSSFAPTATPTNSPTASRPGSPEPEGYKLPGLEDLTKTFYYGASLLRRTFYKSDPSAPQSPTGPQVNLVEQVQAIGVDRFVGLSGSALTVGGVVTSRPATSPLLHLSNLIMSSAKSPSTSVTNSMKPSCTTSLASTTVTTFGQGATGVIMSVSKIPSPGERRPTLPSGAPMGIPGHPGSGHLDTRLSQLKPGQRADLGTVGGRPRPTSLGSVPPRGNMAEPNVGTVGWTSFGRKGGLL